jgi:hypothetical protein
MTWLGLMAARSAGNHSHAFAAGATQSAGSAHTDKGAAGATTHLHHAEPELAALPIDTALA